MVSTENCYKSDNFPVLRQAVLREEYLYQVRLYVERAAFLSSDAGNLRMRVLLGLIEAKATVIDAVIKVDGQLHYLSVLCASSAAPLVFSGIMKRIAPHAIIEEILHKNAEERIATRAVRAEAWNAIPNATAAIGVQESRKILYTLLLEYRALLSEYASIMNQQMTSACRASGCFVQILIFEQNGSICGIPDFQIEQITPGSNGSQLMQLSCGYGNRVLVCDDLICYKEIDIVETRFVSKTTRGFYQTSVQTADGPFSFNLVVPSFL